METGKTVARNLYVHVEALKTLDAAWREAAERAAALAGATAGGDFNVVKLGQDGDVSLLDYPDFFEQAFPALRRCWTVDLFKSSVRYRTYEDSLNPPILHRKELLLPKGHPSVEAFARLTRAAEQIGLFDDPRRIGFRKAWENLLALRGYRVAGHELVPCGNDETQDEPGREAFAGVARHLTALSRSNFSAPVQTLARFGFLDGAKTVFDYGCGRGDDLRGLAENGIEVGGWDPHYAPDRPKRPAHIVNLGFVVNVIEDPAERREALICAYALAEELLVVSAMIANPDAVRGTPYGDGVLTSRNTFQKYYTQAELRDWLAETLDAEPIPVGPGIFYVFKNPESEQRFQAGRQENRRNVSRLAALSRSPRIAPSERGTSRRSSISVSEKRYLEHREILDALWQTCLRLGRIPERGEVADAEALERSFGSVSAALRFVQARMEDAEAILEQARLSRLEDLKVYFADMQFQRRKPYRQLEPGLRRDAKVFFGDYRNALEAGRELLFAAGNADILAAACRAAAEQGVGWLEEGHSLQLHVSLLERLPAVLRSYVRCGLKLYGDAGDADLLKIHIRSGKLTLMRFDDFLGRPLPKMLQRVKLKLRDQDFDIFDYGGDYPPPYLYRKSRYLNEEMPHYAEQLAFDETLESLALFELEGYGPKPDEFDARLEAARRSIDGFDLVRSQTVPDLDAPCGRHFTYRQLVECGETQTRTGIANLPKRPESYTALRDLAANVLDPVIDYFGMVRLTYGFCSPELARQIEGRIAPKLDQHAACELNRKGEPVCPRRGAAADFIVEDEDMEEVARWIMDNLPYDRLYYYGKDRPVHVSHSETPARQAWEMREVGGKRVPKAFR